MFISFLSIKIKVGKELIKGKPATHRQRALSEFLHYP
jgi:hypothetical protein